MASPFRVRLFDMSHGIDRGRIGGPRRDDATGGRVGEHRRAVRS